MFRRALIWPQSQVTRAICAGGCLQPEVNEAIFAGGQQSTAKFEVNRAIFLRVRKAINCRNPRRCRPFALAGGPYLRRGPWPHLGAVQQQQVHVGRRHLSMGPAG